MDGAETENGLKPLFFLRVTSGSHRDDDSSISTMIM